MAGRLASLAALAPLALAAPAGDAVKALPGMPALLSTTYSGYLDIGNGKHLHYLYFTSQSPTAATDPVVLWLNGGPGCSSLEGAFQESGPYWTAAGGNSLQYNNYSWNKFANQLFLEAPACVGFSYADSPAGCTHSDTSTAKDNLDALVQFYTKFPELVNNPFWISGESYAGIYIPMLAYNVYNYNLKAPAVTIPLKGILVGNGCIGNDVGVCGQDSYSDFLSLSQLYRHVMISDPTWATVMANCGDFSHENQACQNALEVASNEAGSNFNVYDMYSGVWGVCAASALAKNPRRPLRKDSALGRILAKQLADVPSNQCTDDDDLTTYMNLPAVQTALNVKATQWQECGGVNYNGDMPDERKEIYPTLTQKAGYKVLIYNGDADACVPVTDNMWWTQSMNYSTVTPWSAWTVEDGTMAGYVTQYAYNLTFTTIRLAGHMVPQTQPIAALKMAKTHILGGSWD